MVTCRFVWTGDFQLRSAIWTRTTLTDYVFRRSHRRIMRKNADRYTVTEGPLRLDDEKQELYEQYLTIAKGERPDDLVDCFGGTDALSRFETRQMLIHDGDGRLVAFCAYDLGSNALMSIMGVYHPDFSGHSLGFWTLLLEIDLAQRHGLDYHYAGYVHPGDSAMDYKLRIGNMEYLDPDQATWQPWTGPQDIDLPVDRIRRNVTALADELNHLGIPAEVFEHRYYEVGAFEKNLAALLDEPLLIHLPEGDPARPLIAWWDLDDGHYRVASCVHIRPELVDRKRNPVRSIDLWVATRKWPLSTHADLAAKQLVRHMRLHNRQ
jgi:arginyl-tRNA--protein-N-Asp/Glu arginylyltransferase